MERSEFEIRLAESIPALRASARALTQNIDDSNDLIQDTLLKALRFWHSFREGTNFKGWLYTIMRNTFIDSYHFKAKRQLDSAQVDDLCPAQLLQGASANYSESKMEMNDINQAIHKLKKDLSIPFTMYYSGYHYHEIAEQLSVPMGTVKTRIHLARKVLQRELKPFRYKVAG